MECRTRKTSAVLFVVAFLVAHGAPGARADGDDTYAALASRVVPEKLADALELLSELSSSSGPGDVKPLRIALLGAREQMDTFAFAFPRRATPCSGGGGDDDTPPPPPDSGPWSGADPDASVPTTWRGAAKRALAPLLRALEDLWDWATGGRHVAAEDGHVADRVEGWISSREEGGEWEEELGYGHGGTDDRVDLWGALRSDLNEGYQLLGDFQDLAHSLVEYNETDVQYRLEACLAWQQRLWDNARDLCYEDYVSQHLREDRLYEHKHTSKLFWGYRGAAPSTRLTGLQNLGVLVRDSQLAQMLSWYPDVVELRADELLEDPGHATFHLLRKQIRSVLGVLRVFPELLPDTRAMTGQQDGDGSSSSSTGGDGAVPRRLAAAASVRGSGAKSISMSMSMRVGGSGGVGRGDDGRCDPAAALELLGQAFKALGKVNDAVFAYQFYSARGSQWSREADQAQRDVEERWRDWVDWAEDVELDRRARCLQAAMPPADGRRGGGGGDHDRKHGDHDHKHGHEHGHGHGGKKDDGKGHDHSHSHGHTHNDSSSHHSEHHSHSHSHDHPHHHRHDNRHHHRHHRRDH